MNVTLAVALVGISALSVLAGIFASLVLLWVAPENPLFEAIESIREIFKDETAEAEPASSQVQQEILSAASAVTPSSIPEPANTDAPAENDSASSQSASPVMEPPSLRMEAEPQMDEEENEQEAETSRRSRQKTELVAQAIQTQPDEHVLDKSEKDNPEEVLEPEPSSSDADELLESGFAADLPDNYKIDGGSSAELDNEGPNDSEEQFAEQVPDSTSDEELEEQSPDDMTVDAERWQDNSSQEEELESGPKSASEELSNDSNSMVDSDDVLSAESFDDTLDDYSPESKSESLEDLPAKPPIDDSDTWGKNLSPEISAQEVLVSERSTVAVGQWEADSPAQDIIVNEQVVRGNGEEIIDDRQIIGGTGNEEFSDMESEGTSRQIIDESQNWKIEGQPTKPKSNKSLEAQTKYNREDRQKAMVLSDYSEQPVEIDTQSQQVIRPKEVTIEKDEEVSTEQLRLEALKNSELRDILLYLKGPEGGESEAEVEDLSEEIGAGHERHVTRYPDGTVKLERNTHDGIAHGEFNAWYENGAPMVRGQYERGRAVGFWTMWDDEETQLIHAEIGKVLQNWDYKAKVRFVQTTPPKSSR
ncbi:MAG: hypothetical protein VYC39_16675 [Myxococcota bacterium]|nr:hypothetical protein [Myxococcota bacterium]